MLKIASTLLLLHTVILLRSASPVRLIFLSSKVDRNRKNASLRASGISFISVPFPTYSDWISRASTVIGAGYTFDFILSTYQNLIGLVLGTLHAILLDQNQQFTFLRSAHPSIAQCLTATRRASEYGMNIGPRSMLYHGVFI